MRPDEKRNLLYDAFNRLAIPVPEGSLIAPSARALANEIGIVPSSLSNPDTLGNGYDEKLEAVTGLEIVASGIVLAPVNSLEGRRPLHTPLSLKK